ncbi:alpha/beta fold hydrolase, partial [Pseudoduganella sp. RAF53_2]|uniref:alpha/beta fold hydrolase n=1 Tax=Pseudoduganella sp. RAF53_2 TaxID=3233060 RepID=UPI003F9A1705
MPLPVPAATITTITTQSSQTAAPTLFSNSNLHSNIALKGSIMYFTTKDGVEIYYKDWGPKDAQPIVFSHGWPLSSDSWESQMFFLANHG